jgi:hypothetical protein
VNWILNSLCGWVGYAGMTPVLNWQSTYADNSGNPFDTTFARADGSSAAFWDPLTKQWIICGSNTAGDYYAGDDGIFVKATTGVASPPKFSFGCSSGGHAILVNSDLLGAGSGPVYAASTAPISTWTKSNLPGTYTAHVQAQDAVDFGGTAIVVGGGDGNHLAWTSTNGGTSWTTNIVGAVTNSITFLSRIIIGASSRLWAWANAAAINGGGKLWYSDNGGTTWTATGSIGFDSISSGVYLAGLNMYVFTSGTKVYYTPDPTTLAFQNVDFGVPARGIGGIDYWATVGIGQSGDFEIFASDDVFATSKFAKKDRSDNAITTFTTWVDTVGGSKRMLAKSSLGIHTSMRW